MAEGTLLQLRNSPGECQYQQARSRSYARQQQFQPQYVSDNNRSIRSGGYSPLVSQHRCRIIRIEMTAAEMGITL